MKYRIESVSRRTGRKKIPKIVRKGKKTKKTKEELREMQENMKWNNTCITGIPEGEEKEHRIEKLFEKIMTENFLNLERGKATQAQEAQRVQIKMNPNRPTPKHIIIKMLIFKDKEFKDTKGKQEVTYKGALIRLATEFSTETI